MDARKNLAVAAIAASMVSFAACSGVAEDVSTKVSAPTFNLVEGTYSSDQSIVITVATEGATVHYTRAEGEVPPDPTADSPVYDAPIYVSGDGTVTTIKAVAIRDGLIDSEILTVTVAIDYSQVSTPQFSVVAGTYESPQEVAITSATPGASIRYTTDGSAPTRSTGMLYSAPITVSASETLNAIAFLPGWKDSTVATAAYAISEVRFDLRVEVNFGSVAPEGYFYVTVTDAATGAWLATSNGHVDEGGEAVALTFSGLVDSPTTEQRLTVYFWNEGWAYLGGFTKDLTGNLSGTIVYSVDEDGHFELE